MSPDQAHGDPATLKLLDQIVREYGQSGRTFKSALIFAVPENDAALRDEARKLLAWEDIRGRRRDGQAARRRPAAATRRRRQEGGPRPQGGGLADLQAPLAAGQGQHAPGDRPRAGQLQRGGLAGGTDPSTGSASRTRSPTSVGPNKLIKAWPPANKEWTTKAVRDAFFSSPALPRLLKPDAIKRTIADGINQKLIAYAGKTASGRYEPFVFEPDVGVDENDIEISDEMVMLKAADAMLLKEPPAWRGSRSIPRTPASGPASRSRSPQRASTSTAGPSRVPR